MNAAIAARALAYKFPHISRGTPIQGNSTGNPFYDTWINILRLEGFLDTSDIGSDVVSLLNGKPIDNGAAKIVGFAPEEPFSRTWIPAPLSIILTLTNLRGIPYRLNFDKELGQSYVDHADYIRFAIVYPGQTHAEPRPDELVLGFDGRRLPQATDWWHFSEFARATAAFPIGFPPRSLSRPTEHYRWRVIAYPPGPGGDTNYKLSWPDWSAMIPNSTTEVPEDWHFLAVDGGATDNEPIELARTALSGLLSHSPRNPKEANRAVWLIDPFAGVAPLGPEKFTTFPAELGAVVTTLTQQTLYDTADLLMAGDDDIYSRFMLTPERGKVRGSDAIASAGLGAFIGFACPEFMRHDYILGRTNCQEFLRTKFVLDPANAIFEGWTQDQKTNLAVRRDGCTFLPIIPLTGEVAVNESAESWPKGKLDPESFRDQIEARFRRIFELEVSGSFFRSVVGLAGAHLTQRQAADFVIGMMRESLEKAGL